MKPIFLILAAALLLAGCGPAPNPVQPSPPALQNSPSPSAPGSTTAVLPAKSTPIPSFTKLPAGVTLTLSPAALTPTPSPEYAATLIAPGGVRRIASLSSPDKVWRAEVLQYGCRTVGPGQSYVYQVLRVVRRETGVARIVDTQTNNCQGLGATGLGRLLWSPNGNYLYYSNASEGVPDGLVCNWDPPLIQYDLETAQKQALTLGAVSPGRMTLAMRQGNIISLWDLNRGETAKISGVVPNATIADLSWSPDGLSLAYVQTENACPPFGKSYLVRLDRDTLENSLLYTSAEITFNRLVWDAPTHISLSGSAGQKWGFNLFTKQMQVLKK